jgi:Rieske Fe-S protein
MSLFRRPSDQPLWRDEFSVFAGDERYVSRRQFTKFLVLVSAGMFAGNLWILLKSLFRSKPAYAESVVAQTGHIPVGGVELFNYPTANDPCILIRLAEDRFVAYSQKCTHLSCAVYYQHEQRRLACPCHEGFFAVEDGRVLQGPPPRPLPRVAIERRGDDLVALRVEREEP